MLKQSVILRHLKRFHRIYFFTEMYFPEYDLLLRCDFLSFVVIAK